MRPEPKGDGDGHKDKHGRRGALSFMEVFRLTKEKVNQEESKKKRHAHAHGGESAESLTEKVLSDVQKGVTQRMKEVNKKKKLSAKKKATLGSIKFKFDSKQNLQKKLDDLHQKKQDGKIELLSKDGNRALLAKLAQGLTERVAEGTSKQASRDTTQEWSNAPGG